MQGSRPFLAPVEAFPGALAGDERLVALVDVGGDQRRRFGVGPGDDDGRNVADVGRQPGRGQRADVLLGRDQHLAAEVAALLLRGQLVLPVRTRDTGGDHGLLQLVHVQRATEAGLAVGDDRGQPVLHRTVALDLGDLVGAQQCVVDPANDLRAPSWPGTGSGRGRCGRTGSRHRRPASPTGRWPSGRRAPAGRPGCRSARRVR